MRKALAAFFPALDGVHLVDYKVRILDGDAATAARTRVIIESAHESGTWTTAGAEANIIAASLIALHDSLEYAIWRLDARPERRDERSAGHAAAARRGLPQPAGEPPCCSAASTTSGCCATRGCCAHRSPNRPMRWSRSPESSSRATRTAATCTSGR
jgi:hypothetical protein